MSTLTMVAFPPAVAQIVNATYPLGRQQLADQLAAIECPLYFFFTAFELAFLWWFYYSGASASMRSAIESKIKNPLLCVAVYACVFFVLLSLVMLPLTYYASFILSHQFGLSGETNARWFRDWAVSIALSAAIIAIVGSLFLRSVARFRSWPLIASVAAAALLVFGSAIFPVFIAPLFNTFTPLPSSPLTRSILNLARAQGLDASVVYEYNMSLQTREANAYVAGLGKTERIAVGDTLLQSMKPDEVIYVMAHEMGHYKLGHLWLGTFEGWVGVVVFIVILATLGVRLAARNPRFSRSLADPAAIPLIAIMLIVFQLITAPIANALSRQIEHAADMFAATHTHLGDAGVRAEARIASQDLVPLHPSRIVVWYFYTHPPADQRILDAARAAKLVP